jgi:hypothetical protein
MIYTLPTFTKSLKVCTKIIKLQITIAYLCILQGCKSNLSSEDITLYSGPAQAKIVH